MSILAKVQAVFDASSAVKAKEDIDKLKNASPEAASALGQLEAAFKALTSPIGLLVSGLTAAMGGMVALGFSAIETADNLRDMSIGTGKAIEDLQTLQSVAEKSGGTLEGVATGLDYISRNLAKGGDETMKYTKALEFFNVSQTDANGNLREAGDIAQEVAQKFNETENSTSKSAAAADALGKNYAQLIPTYLELNTSQEEQNYLYSVGAIVTKEQANASDEYNDTMHDVHSILKGVGNFVAQTMLPLLIAFAQQMKESATNGGTLEGVLNVLKVAFEGLVGVAKGVMAVFIGIDTVFQVAGKSLGAFMAIADRLIHGDFAGAKNIFKDLGNDVDDLAQKAGKRINDMFTSVQKNAKYASEEIAKVDRGNYRNTNERTVKVKVEGLSDLEKADQALNDLIDQMTKQNKLIETQSKLQETLAALEGARYSAGSQALKDQAIALARVNDQLNAKKKLEKDLEDLQKSGDQEVRQLEDEVRKRTMSNAAYRQYIQLRQIDLQVSEKLKGVNANIDGAEKRRQAIIEEGIKQKARVKTATEEVAKADQDWTVGANQAMLEYQDKVGSVANNTKELMTNAFSSAEDALVKLVTTGKADFGALAQSIIADLARMAIRALMTKAIMAFVGSFSAGGAFEGGEQTPFASGGVVTSPTTFPMANGQGLMGEAGPEAVMPLTRMPNGRLGVASEGGGGGGMVMNVGGININVSGGSSGNAKDDKEMSDKIAASVQLQLKALVNSELHNQRRPGGQLNPTRISGTF